MKNIFTDDGLSNLARFARSNVYLAFDYDGTLAPIVARPDQAQLAPRTRDLLERLSRIYPCAIISGRARLDALERLESIQRWAATDDVLGGADAYEHKVNRWGQLIRDALVDHAGVLVEDKRFSIAIHYRNAVDQRAALAAIDRAVQRLDGARVLGGKMVVNVLPADAPHKGLALDCMRRWALCDTAIYVGDDVTDEDAFSLPSDEVLSIRVGPSAATRATYFLDSQREIDRLLTLLIEAREQAVRFHAHL